jgi:hypothetical protein
MHLSEPVVTNALLRCTRTDTNAAPLFEKVRGDLDVWIWELGSQPFLTWSKWSDQTLPQLEANLSLLTELGEGSQDYTLHLMICARQLSPIRIPSQLSRLSLKAGFAIEIGFSSDG